jgi:long-chain fatty acid transport protein
MIKSAKLPALLATSLGLLAYSQLSYSAAFQFYELATAANGTAAVGQAAIADNASIAYYNPAGMALLNSTQLLIGTQIALPYTNFSTNSANTIRGTNGANAGELAPGGDIFFVYNLSPKFKLGLSMTTPYAGALNYETHWVGRYFIQQMTFYTINLNPSVAYKINDWVSVGAGLSIEYANLFQSVAIPVTTLIDGQLTLKTDNFAPGGNVGIIFTPKPETTIGVAFRSQIVHNLSGRTTFNNLSITPSVTTNMVMPANVIGSLAQKVSKDFTVLGELGWSNWSSMKNTAVSIRSLSFSTPQNWKNTYRVGIGGRYQATPKVLWMLGTSYDSSPTTTSRRTPNLPMDRQIRAGTGVEYSTSNGVKVGFSYEYINFGNAAINNTASTGVLAGSYSRNYANIVQGSINVEL